MRFLLSEAPHTLSPFIFYAGNVFSLRDYTHEFRLDWSTCIRVAVADEWTKVLCLFRTVGFCVFVYLSAVASDQVNPSQRVCIKKTTALMALNSKNGTVVCLRILISIA